MPWVSNTNVERKIGRKRRYRGRLATPTNSLFCKNSSSGARSDKQWVSKTYLGALGLDLVKAEDTFGSACLEKSGFVAEAGLDVTVQRLPQKAVHWHIRNHQIWTRRLEYMSNVGGHVANGAKQCRKDGLKCDAFLPYLSVEFPSERIGAMLPCPVLCVQSLSDCTTTLMDLPLPLF